MSTDKQPSKNALGWTVHEMRGAQRRAPGALAARPPHIHIAQLPTGTGRCKDEHPSLHLLQVVVDLSLGHYSEGAVGADHAHLNV